MVRCMVLCLSRLSEPSFVRIILFNYRAMVVITLRKLLLSLVACTRTFVFESITMLSKAG